MKMTDVIEYFKNKDLLFNKANKLVNSKVIDMELHNDLLIISYKALDDDTMSGIDKKIITLKEFCKE